MLTISEVEGLLAAIARLMLALKEAEARIAELERGQDDSKQ